MIEFALAAYLATRPPVTDIVGPRISADLAEQDDPRPLLTYRLIPGSTRHYHSQGASGLVEAHIELTCQGNAYVEARGLYDVLRDELDGFQGAWDGTEVRRAALSERPRVEVEAELASSSFSDFKGRLADLAVAKLSPIAAEMRRISADPGYIDQVLRQGAERADAIAAPILREVEGLVGFLRP